ncbi:6-bladed beta-propeller [Algoriphagus boritolerans]|uniref:6-bladed beta-propeller n=1 Tax=Algoriphagus boritolerans TaxID=308111 RepID=UPI000AD53114
MKNLSIIILLFFLIGCKSYESGIERNTFSIAPNPAVVEIAKIFKQISPIQLKGTDLPLTVYRVLPHSGGYYMLDGKKQSVLSTDGDGKILKVLNAVGDGPGEYREIWDIKINPRNEDLYILDRKLAKMLVYSASLEFIEEVPIKREFVGTLLSFGFINGDEVLFHTSGTSGYKFLKYGLSPRNLNLKSQLIENLKDLDLGMIGPCLY